MAEASCVRGSGAANDELLVFVPGIEEVSVRDARLVEAGCLGHTTTTRAPLPQFASPLPYHGLLLCPDTACF